MTQINRSVLVPHSAQALYELVLDVNAYPEFLPWCSGASVTEQSDTHQLATVNISKGVLHTAFTTRNDLQPNQAIAVSLVDGPFRSLEGWWQFRTLDANACKVELEMKFEFSTGPVGVMLKPVFTHICSTLLNAFVERANKIYA